jgi:hypothetical protein
MNLANLFEVDWSLCTDERAKANNFWWHALKNYEFERKTYPTKSALEWRDRSEIGADLFDRATFLRHLEELAAYRFEAVRRVVLQSSDPIWSNLDLDVRHLLINALGRGYNPGCLYLCHDPGRPESAVDLTNGLAMFWDVAQPDHVLIHNFRMHVEMERLRFGINPKNSLNTKGMTTSPPQWHLLELLDERFQRALDVGHRKVGRPSLSGASNDYSAAEHKSVRKLVQSATEWADSCYRALPSFHFP